MDDPRPPPAAGGIVPSAIGAGQWGEDPAVVAHRYALSMPNVDTVAPGVKNRAELARCLAAETASPMDPALIAAIDALGLAAA